MTVFSLTGYAAPIFWTGLLLLLLFGSVWPILPVVGMADVAHPRHRAWPISRDVARHLVLPSMTLALVFIAQYSRLARVNMIDVSRPTICGPLRAKGLPERVVILKHGLRNALIPIVHRRGAAIRKLVRRRGAGRDGF